MSSVEEIKSAITSLSQEDYARLRDWFSERDWEKWDEEIEKDSAAGKLDFLVKEAVAEKNQGLLKKLWMHKATSRFRVLIVTLSVTRFLPSSITLGRAGKSSSLLKF